MGDFFRSEKMSLCQLIIPLDAAYATVAELGERSCIHFRDLNAELNLYQRRYVNEVRGCELLQQNVDFIAKEIKRDKIEVEKLEEHELQTPAPNTRELADLEAAIEHIEQDLRGLRLNGDSLLKNYMALNEHRLLLEHSADFFDNAATQNSATTTQSYLDYVTGIIRLDRFFAFERMLWRIGHGNIFLKRFDLEPDDIKDPLTGETEQKVIFIAYFQGAELQQRIVKISKAFHVSEYPCPNASEERAAMLAQLKVNLADMQLVLNQTIDERKRLLVAAAGNMNTWQVMIVKAKSIYHTLNNFNQDMSKQCLIAEGWVPICDLPVLQQALQQGTKVTASSMASFVNVVEAGEDVPPTYYRTNKFTACFQNLTDAYGMASYREVNPSLYSCVTFPFLFAVMFGDMGHGFLMFLCGFYLVLKEKKLCKIKEEIFHYFFVGRYLIVLMGLFSIYTGFVYNDIFSKSINIFGSGWRVDYNVNNSTVRRSESVTLDPTTAVVSTYIYGVDPVWQLAANKIVFINAYKMKMSIVMGVMHMLFGLSFSVVNYNYFKQRLNIIFKFLPQLIFLLVLFGYMVFMMFFKWLRYSAKATDTALKPGCAPSVLNLFINMILFGHTKVPKDCNEYMFDGQQELQIVLLVLAGICIPWMLFAKPLYIRHQRKQARTNNFLQAAAEQQDQEALLEVEEPMSEELIHEAIDTVEYVLSTISHTASYLRLWALSLAHAQLSDVIYEKLLKFGFMLPLGYFNVVLIWLLFWPFASLSFFILVLLEGLSAFLHTLRLHWVEFNSKCYMGLGYAYEPFCFQKIFEQKDD